MARIIATLWDDNRWLAAVAHTRGTHFTIERWFDGAMESNSVIGKTLEAAGLSKEPIWIAVGRGRVELRPQRFPLLPAAELPSAVRFQALQQSTSDRLLCDYLPLREDERGIELLVAVASGELADVVAASVAPLRVERMALRPLCSAAWMSLAQRSAELPDMLIDPSSGEAQFIIFRQGSPVFVRSVRLVEGPAAAQALAAEAKRSLMASGIAESLGDTPPIVALWGNDETAEQYAAALRQTLTGPVHVSNPSSLRDDIPSPPELASAGMVAGVLGLLQAGLSNPDRLIDLVQPRKTPEPPSRKSTYIALGAIAASAACLMGYMSWKTLNDLKAESLALAKESNSLNPFVEKAKAQQANLAQIERFAATQVDWLKQLADFSQSSPPANQMIVEQFSGLVSLGAGGAPPGGGVLTVRGAVTEPSMLGELEKNLREAGDQVTRGKVTSDPTKGNYRWEFQEIVRIPTTPAAPLSRSLTLVEPSASETRADSSPQPVDSSPDTQTQPAEASPESTSPKISTLEAVANPPADPSVADPALATPAVVTPEGTAPESPAPASAVPTPDAATQQPTSSDEDLQ